jgi:transposase, IS5 family
MKIFFKILVAVDRGYRRVRTPKLITGLRRRSAIEPEIGHMKSDGRLARSPLKGTIGDTLFAVLSGCCHNIRKILAHLRGLLALITAVILVTCRHHQSGQDCPSSNDLEQAA